MVEAVDINLIQTRESKEKDKKQRRDIFHLFQVNGVDIGLETCDCGVV